MFGKTEFSEIFTPSFRRFSIVFLVPLNETSTIDMFSVK